jgi:hypothetical protein
LTLRDVLGAIDGHSTRAWLYLPSETPWTLESAAEVLESEEVPPELEDEPDAGMPELAKQLGLIQVLPVSVVQDIVSNARDQRPNVPAWTLLDALLHYYEHDAFLRL